jgi:hypothetical protein
MKKEGTKAEMSFIEDEHVGEDFGSTIKVEGSVFHLYEDQLGDNIVENRIIKMLDNEMFDIFKSSIYYEKYRKRKKADSNDRVKMYYYFKEELLKRRQFTNMEIFIAFAEFFDINYTQLYSEIGVLDKEGLLRELNDKYGLANKIKTKRLF